MSKITAITLDQLEVDAMNARVCEADTDLEQLMASIRSHGLIQPLTVRKHGNTWAVTAGQRRLLALERIALQDGTDPATVVVSCQITEHDDGTAREISLAENITQLPMNPVDQFEAFTALVVAGYAPEAIAKRFGTETRYINQRLALAGLAEPLREALRIGRLTMEQAKAFTTATNVGEQVDLIEEWGGIDRACQQTEHVIRFALAKHDLSPTSPIARIATEQAYLDAGGTIRADLFSNREQTWLDRKIAITLARNTMEEIAAEICQAEGWGWSEVRFATEDQNDEKRAYPDHGPLPDEEQEAIDKLEQERNDLQENWSEWTERHDAKDREISVQIDAIETRNMRWTDDEGNDMRPRLGIIVRELQHHAHDKTGRGYVVERGWWKPKDYAAMMAAKMAADQKRGTGTDHPALSSAPPAASVTDHGEEPEETGLTDYKAHVIAQLLDDHALAVKMAIAENHALAYDVMLATIICEIRPGYCAAPMHLNGNLHHSPRGETFRELNDTASTAALAVDGSTFSDVLATVRTMQQHDKAALLAKLVATMLKSGNSIDQHTGSTMPHLVSQLADAADVDMRDHWQADTDWLQHLTKAQLADAALSVGAVKAADVIRKTTHDNSVARAARELDGKRWLPAVLRGAAYRRDQWMTDTAPEAEAPEAEAPEIVRQYSAAGPCLKLGRKTGETAKFVSYSESNDPDDSGTRISKEKVHTEPCRRCTDHPETDYPNGYMD